MSRDINADFPWNTGELECRNNEHCSIAIRSVPLHR